MELLKQSGLFPVREKCIAKVSVLIFIVSKWRVQVRLLTSESMSQFVRAYFDLNSLEVVGNV